MDPLFSRQFDNFDRINLVVFQPSATGPRIWDLLRLRHDVLICHGRLRTSRLDAALAWSTTP